MRLAYYRDVGGHRGFKNIHTDTSREALKAASAYLDCPHLSPGGGLLEER
jgi:hypothetical protein